MAASVVPPVRPAGKMAPREERTVLSVGELTRQIKASLERGFGRVTVRGEVSGFRGPQPRGHLYFQLKDADACLDVKVWASTAQRMRFQLRDGLSLIIEGTLDVYEPQGRYSFIAQRLEPAGEGALALAFEQLKERLAREGLMGPGRKRPPRPLPFLPRRIGVVTSLHGAAIRDFVRVLHQRHPRLSLLVCDARVQGDGAAVEVARAIERVARAGVDVVVVTRGGGSREDLWTFNEELVARAIHACPVPVVSAIGHEVDFTISDFVADFRAPTPSAAAERLAPVLADLEHGLGVLRHRLWRAVRARVLQHRQGLGEQRQRLGDPRHLLSHRRLHLAEHGERMRRALVESIRWRREWQAQLRVRLAKNRPQAQLARNREVFKDLSQRLRRAMAARVRAEREQHRRLTAILGRHRPELAPYQARLAKLGERLATLERRRVGALRGELWSLGGRLSAMSPLEVLARGYSLTFREEGGQVVRRASDVRAGDRLVIRVTPERIDSVDGCDEIVATVQETRTRR